MLAPLGLRNVDSCRRGGHWPSVPHRREENEIVFGNARKRMSLRAIRRMAWQSPGAMPLAQRKAVHCTGRLPRPDGLAMTGKNESGYKAVTNSTRRCEQYTEPSGAQWPRMPARVRLELPPGAACFCGFRFSGMSRTERCPMAPDARPGLSRIASGRCPLTWCRRSGRRRHPDRGRCRRAR